MGKAIPGERLSVTAPEPGSPSLSNRLAEAIATGFGIGRAPVAPATVGSAVAAVVFALAPVDSDSPWWLVPLLLGLGLGTWASHAIRSSSDPDPRRAVIDEVVGMWLTVAFLDKTAWWILAGFLTFRVLDVLKPWPIRRFEALPGGMGIMADDLAAGILGAAILNAVRLIFFT